jgi:ectoine hydroxylase-related dioxygenase (phytanoyl-CoA dioxygenase family)
MPDLHRHGYEIGDLVLSDSACERIAEELPEVGGGRGGVRDLIAHPTVVAMMERLRFPGLVMVKATLFDKTPASNWRVQWHQDRVLKLGERRVEPPPEVLEEMLAVRVHLDACGPDNGPLRVIPGSHRLGRLSAEEIARLAASGPIAELTLPQGALLYLRPLLVHSSPPAAAPGHRRVLHIELAPQGTTF